MIVDENLNDNSNKIIKHLKAIATSWFIAWILMFIAFILAFFYLIKRTEDAEELKEQLVKEEQVLSLEYSVGYWFINTPEQINDSVLYQFLIENNAWYPDILLKQAKLESGNYTSNVYNNSNNLYGMKKVGSRQTTQLKNTYNGYGCYTNWCESVLDRMLWDIYYFKGNKPSREEYLNAMSIYAEDENYLNKIK